MTVFVYPNLEKKNALQCTKETCDILRGFGVDIVMNQALKERVCLEYINYAADYKCLSDCLCIICIGGDGTILRAASHAVKYGCPILGINCGRLGFMSSIEQKDLSLLKNLCNGNYALESRMMIDVTVSKSDGSKTIRSALNDAVISHGVSSRIQDFTVLADNVVISSLRADGLIFSTPTGSSAYSLSAGGPLIEPTIDCIEFTQICPHSLFSRTMLISPEREIEVKYNAAEGSKIAISVDGNAPILLDPADRLFIKRSENCVNFINLNANNYFNSISTKLMQPTKDA